MAFRRLNAYNDRGNAVDCISTFYENGTLNASRTIKGGSEVYFVLKAKRSLAVMKASLLFASDGCEAERIGGYWFGLDNGFDLYRFDLPEKAEAGLYFYGYELHTTSGKWFVRAGGSVGYDEVFTGKLLVCDEKYSAPTWLDGGIIYHIFVDRFNKGSKQVPVRDDVVMLDWDKDIPEYPEKPGAFLRNNTFFGGTLWGVAEKLDYLKDLGVSCIYLSPVFKAYSNHKYDTGDYMQVDEMFGGDEALKNLFDEANKRGIGVILDGVFNHVGDDSVYFDKYGKYGGNGAYCSKKSPYYNWFTFKKYPDVYEAWWGIGNLPRVTRTPAFRKLIYGKGGVVEKYMQMGASGFRFDVVDELEIDFVNKLCSKIKKHKKDAYIVGEVWEDASDKTAYGERKQYFWGSQLDAVMNYPLRSAIIEYVLHGKGRLMADVAKTLYRHYPEHKSAYMMNVLGTHDTERILTVLSGETADGFTNDQLAEKRLDALQRSVAFQRLKNAVLLQMTLPGTPCVYYGDEAGMEGYKDPFNRFPYPWGKEDKKIYEWYRKLIGFRKTEPALSSRSFKVCAAKEGLFAFSRVNEDDSIVVYTNMGGMAELLKLDGAYISLLTNDVYKGAVRAYPGSGDILKRITL